MAAGSAGTVTRLPAEGAVIERGGVLYELDGRVRPRLLYGDRPLWRPLGPKVSDGADVLQLEQNLKAMGYAPKGMKVNRHWDAKTTTAVKRWQKATGRKQDATLDGADLAFLPGAVRVASHQAEVGAAVAPGAPVLGTTDGHARRDAGPVRQPPGPRGARPGRHRSTCPTAPSCRGTSGRSAAWPRPVRTGPRPPSRSPSTSIPGRPCRTSTPRR